MTSQTRYTCMKQYNCQNDSATMWDRVQVQAGDFLQDLHALSYKCFQHTVVLYKWTGAVHIWEEQPCPNNCLMDNSEVTTVGTLEQEVPITIIPGKAVLSSVDGQYEVPC